VERLEIYFFLLDADGEQIGIRLIASFTAWSGIKRLGKLIRLFTNMLSAINGLALVSNIILPATVLTVLYG